MTKPAPAVLQHLIVDDTSNRETSSSIFRLCARGRSISDAGVHRSPRCCSSTVGMDAKLAAAGSHATRRAGRRDMEGPTAKTTTYGDGRTPAVPLHFVTDRCARRTRSRSRALGPRTPARVHARYLRRRLMLDVERGASEAT